MTWNLSIRTKSSGEHTVEFEAEAEAKEALARATGELERRRGGLATIEGTIVVPRDDVTAMTVYEALDDDPMVG